MTNGKENEVSYFIIQLLDDVVHVSVAAVLPVHLLPQGDGVELVLDHQESVAHALPGQHQS